MAAAANKNTIYAFCEGKELYSLLEINAIYHPFLVYKTPPEVYEEYQLIPFLYQRKNQGSGLIGKDFIIQNGDILILLGNYQAIQKFPEG